MSCSAGLCSVSTVFVRQGGSPSPPANLSSDQAQNTGRKVGIVATMALALNQGVQHWQNLAQKALLRDQNTPGSNVGSLVLAKFQAGLICSQNTRTFLVKEAQNSPPAIDRSPLTRGPLVDPKRLSQSQNMSPLKCHKISEGPATAGLSPHMVRRGL